MLFYGSGANKLKSSNFVFCPRWVETGFCRDKTRREIMSNSRQDFQDRSRQHFAFKTRQDFRVLCNVDSRQDETLKDFKMSRRDGTRQHFPSRLGREFETRNFPTHHCYIRSYVLNISYSTLTIDCFC